MTRTHLLTSTDSATRHHTPNLDAQEARTWNVYW